MIAPAFLAFAFLGQLIYLHLVTDFDLWFLAFWIASGTAPMSIVQGQMYVANWGGTMEEAGIALSMTVNALVTGLIVFRIFKVFQESKTIPTDDQSSGDTGGSTLQRVMFILIESGMALFLIQVARLVGRIVRTDAGIDTYYLIVGIHEILNVIIRSIISTLFY